MLICFSVAVRAYYEHNETKVFSFSRPTEKIDHSIADIAPSICFYTEKTTLYCAEGKRACQAP